MQNIKNRKTLILFILFIVFLIGAFVPYFNSSYNKYNDTFIENYNEYYNQLDEAESYEKQAKALDPEIARASLIGNETMYRKYSQEQNDLQRLSKLTKTIAESYYKEKVTPYRRLIDDVKSKRLTIQIISGVLSCSFLISGIIVTCVINKKKKEKLNSSENQ